MTNPIGFIPEEVGETEDGSLVVDLAIVPEHVHTMFGACPHCNSEREAELKTYIHDTEGLKSMMVVMGDLLKCEDCTGLFLVMEFPAIDHDDFIMTRWKIPEHLRAGM